MTPLRRPINWALFQKSLVLAIIIVGPYRVLCAQKGSADDATLADLQNVRRLLAGTSSLKPLTVSGQVVFSDASTASFKASAASDSYKLLITFPSGRLTSESLTDHHGSSSCELQDDSRVPLRSSDGVCGYPFPWLFVPLTLAHPDVKTVLWQSAKNGSVLTLTAHQGKVNAHSSPAPSASLEIDLAKGVVSRYSYYVADSRHPGQLLRMEVSYGDFALYQGALWPRSITRAINGGDLTTFTIQTIGGQE